MSAHQSASEDETDLRVAIERDCWADFEGAAVALIDEGLIPDGFEWPQGVGSKYWEANGFEYWLRRVRPAGHKGPRCSWQSLDYWRVRVEVIGRDFNWRVRRALERKAEQLRIDFHQETPVGAKERRAKFNRYLAARQDRAFQAFKERVPGLVAPKRGRKPNGAAQQNGQGVTP